MASVAREVADGIKAKGAENVADLVTKILTRSGIMERGSWMNLDLGCGRVKVTNGWQCPFLVEAIWLPIL